MVRQNIIMLTGTARIG